MDLLKLRKEIDGINLQMLALFEKRMMLSRQVAEYKRANNMQVFDPAREVAILEGIRKEALPPMVEYDTAFFNTILSLSRDYQEKILNLPASPDEIPGVIKTKNLRLQPMTPNDLPPVHYLTSNPEVAKFMRFETCTAPEQTGKLMDKWTAPPNRTYLVIQLESEQFAGVFSFKPSVETPGEVDLSIFLDKPYWNRGYAGELLEMAKEQAKDMLGATHMLAYVVDANLGSRRALEKAGFTVERTLDIPDLEGGLHIYKYAL